MKLIPFPSAVGDDDVAMSESPVYDFEAYHVRLRSTASSVSSSSLSTSRECATASTNNQTRLKLDIVAIGNPMMDLYPEVNTDPASSPSIGLLQPNGSMTSLNQ